jgi:hypothetical protein
MRQLSSKRAAPRLRVLLVLALALPACGELEPEAEDPPDGIDSVAYALSSIDCTESAGTGYVSGKAFSITLVTVDGKKVQKDTANAYYVMAKAAAAKGVNLKVVSGFRTMAEQTYLYNCYIHCSCNNCNLAAKPGYSNHQSGHALDLNTSSSGVLAWLNAHGASYGFKRTVPSEDWHWEWWGGGPGGGPCVDKPTYPLLTIKASAVTISGQARDLCTREKSEGIFDLLKGQEVEIEVDVKNSGSAVGKNVKVGLWAEAPYLAVVRWNILSDWKASGSFKTNDTDALQKLPHENPPQSFELNLGALSVGETKRIKLVVRAETFSLGLVDHPDLRAFVAHMDDFYEKQDFAAKPKNVEGYQQQNGGDLKAFVQTDVLGEESCDGKDNDCDGEIDEGLSCGGAPADPPASDPPASEPDPPSTPPAPSVPTAPAPRESLTEGGCALAGAPGTDELAGLALLLALALARRRRRA